jgi:hypothetical protein
MEKTDKSIIDRTMLKSGIGATEDTLRERAAAPGGRAQPRSQPRRGHRAVQRQERHSRDAPQLHWQPAPPQNRYGSQIRHYLEMWRTSEVPFVYLEMDGARLAAERPTEGMEREAAERQAAEATRAAARKVEAMSKDWWGSEMGEDRSLGLGSGRCGGGCTKRSAGRFHSQVGPFGP